jgi:hypothetical protein
MRKTGIVLGVIGGLFVLALVGIWIFANPNNYRDTIQAELEKQSGRKVTLGAMSLGFLPLRFQVESPTVAEDENFNIAGRQQPFVKADNLDVRVRLMPLLHGNIEIDSLELTRPSVELVRNKQGVWNFSTLGPKASPAGTPGKTGSEAPSKGGVALGKLVIRDGQLGITDLQTSNVRTGYDHIDLTLADFAPGKPFSFDLAAHMQGKGNQEVRLKGDAGPLAADSEKTPFHGDIAVKEVEIASLMKFFDSKAVTSANGVLSGETKITNQDGIVTANGTMNLDHARINDIDIGYPIKADYKLSTKVAQSLITIEEAKAQLGQTPLSVAGTLNTGGRVPVMDLKVKSGDVSIAEIARLASAFGVAFGKGTTVNGRVSADVHATGPMAKPELTGTVSGHDLQISGQGIPQPVRVQAINLNLSPTTIRSNEFSATSGKTTVIGQVSVLQYASNSPSVDVGLRAPSATLNEIQSIAKAYGMAGLDQLKGDGSLNFDFRAKGTLQELSAASAMKGLNGTLNLDFSPLHVAGFEPGREFAKLGSFASNLSDDISAEIVRFTGHILVKDGVAQTDDLKAQLNVGSMAATGTADLTTESLNLHTATIFSKEFSDKILSNRRANIMSIALSNAGGEIVLPAIITGTFKQPKLSPDLQALAQLQRQKLLPGMDNPRAAIGNVLGVLTGAKKEAAQGQPAGTESQPPSEEKKQGLKGLLDLFGRKKTQ